MIHNQYLRLFCLYIILSFPPSFLGQTEKTVITNQTSPEEILLAEIPVVTASKKLQKESEASASVVVITSEDIKKSGARTVAEAVQFVAGLNVFGLENIDIRGVGAGSRVLFLTDGRRNNDVFTGGFESGFERSLTNVERIEVIKGPASSLYGTNAFAGIINVISKNSSENKGLSLTVSGGNLTFQTYEALLGIEAKKLDMLFSFTAHSDKGNDMFGTNDQVRTFDVFGKIKWSDFTLLGRYRPNRRAIPNLGGILTPTSFTKRSDTVTSLGYENTFKEKLTIFSQIYMQNEVLFFADPNGNLDVRDLRIEAEARANYRFNKIDNLTFGFEARRDRTNNVKNSVTERYRSNNKSFYIENELRPINRLSFTTGLRVDDNTVFGSSLNPRLAIVSTLSSKTIIKGFFGRAFRGPDFINLFTDIQAGFFTILKNPNLKPEIVKTVELEASQRVSNFLEGRINIYRNFLDNLIVTTIVGNKAVFANIGKVSTSGVEISLKGNIGKDLSFFANESIQFAENKISQTRLPLIPRNTLNLGLVYESKKKFRVALFGKYVSQRPTTNSLTARPINLNSYFKADITFSTKFSKQLEFSTAIYNIFNVKYDRGFASPQNGTQAVFKLNYLVN
ncbi:MAG: TonB-dependent receptor [Blastocatellia bacterium]